MSLHYLKKASGLNTIKVPPDEHRSVLVVCDTQTPSDNDCQIIHDWIHETPDEPAKYVCFAGAFSEQAHDDYDWLNIKNDRFALTTWHNDGVIDDIAFFFLQTVTMVQKGMHAQIVISYGMNAYEQQLVKTMKTWDYE